MKLIRICCESITFILYFYIIFVNAFYSYIFIKYFLFFYKFRQTLQNYGVILSFALTHKEGGDYMSSYDLIWKLVLMLLAQKDASIEEKKTKEEKQLMY